MAETPKGEKGLEMLSELYNNYAEAIRNIHINSQKQYQTAHRTCVEAIRNTVQEAQSQDALRSYLESLQSAWAKQDAQQYMEATRQYARAVQDAQSVLQKKCEEAYRAFLDETQKTWKEAAESQRKEFETYIKSLQDAFSKVDTKNLDAATLARLAHTTLPPRTCERKFRRCFTRIGMRGNGRDNG
jgi:flagellar biosynthesis GTPase FlhF